MRETPIFLLSIKNLTSPSCSPTQISYKMQEFLRFGHKYGPNCIFFIAHAQNGLIYTSCQKSDVTIVFHDTPISYTTREFWRYVNILGRYCIFHICVDFQDLSVKDGGRPPSWIRFRMRGTTHDATLVLRRSPENFCPNRLNSF